MKEEESLSWSELMKKEIRLIKQDDKITLNKPSPLTLWDLLTLREMAKDPKTTEVWISSQKYESFPERIEEKKRVLKKVLELEEVKNYLITYEKLEDKAKTMGKSKKFKKRKLDVLYYPYTLRFAIQELKAWWRKIEMAKPKDKKANR